MTSGKTLLYGVADNPPWYLCIFLAVQQFLTCFSGVVSYPLIISGAICITGDQVGLGELINTVIFVCGLSSILQTTFGVRLPILQGASYAFITPVFVLMSKHNNKCIFNNRDVNETLPFEVGSDQHRNLWQSNLSEISGCLMVASAIQMVLGFGGFIGILIRYIGPLTIAPTITLIGVSIFDLAAEKGSSQWIICIITIVLITLFSQYINNVSIPFFGGNRIYIFSLFSVLLGLVITWLICWVLTESDVFPDKPGEMGYLARTDTRIDAIHNAKWFKLPYPGQWGAPSISVGGVLGMVAATVASIIESVGDYYACARLCRVGSPPTSAVNRGIGMEGITCFLAGAWGTGGGNTSYSQNIGAIGITKVGSRLVTIMAGVIMLILGCFGKFGALFVLLPDPVIGGLLYIMLGMVTAVGVSNLQHVDMNSTRNLFIFGFSFFFGLSVPKWATEHPFELGNDTANQVVNVLCGTNMLVGGILACFLDNTIPGTQEERGLLARDLDELSPGEDLFVYDIPFVQPLLKRLHITRFLPFCQGFKGDHIKTKGNNIDANEQKEENENIDKPCSMETKVPLLMDLETKLTIN